MAFFCAMRYNNFKFFVKACNLRLVFLCIEVKNHFTRRCIYGGS